MENVEQIALIAVVVEGGTLWGMWGLMRANFCGSPHGHVCAMVGFLSTAMTGSKNNLTWLAKPSQSKPKTQGIVELLMKSQLDFMPDQRALVLGPWSCLLLFGPLCRMQSQCATRWQEKQGPRSLKKLSLYH